MTASDFFWIVKFVAFFLFWLVLLGALAAVVFNRKQTDDEDKLNRDIARDDKRLREMARLPNPHHIQDPVKRAEAQAMWDEYLKGK